MVSIHHFPFGVKAVLQYIEMYKNRKLGFFLVCSPSHRAFSFPPPHTSLQIAMCQ